MGVTKIGGKLRQVVFDVIPAPIPLQKSPDGEAVTKVMKSRAMGIVRSASTDPVAAGMMRRLLAEGPLLALARAIDASGGRRSLVVISMAATLGASLIAASVQAIEAALAAWKAGEMGRRGSVC